MITNKKLKNTFCVCLPNNIKFTLVHANQKPVLYLYNADRYFIIELSENFLHLDQTTNVLAIKTKTSSTTLIQTFKYSVVNLFYGLEFYFLNKLKFAGKSFRVEKKDAFNLKLADGKKPNIYNYKFGHSFLTWIFIKGIKQKHLKKTKMFFLSTNQTELKNKLTRILRLRMWDIYTQRGLRFSKQKIWKKPGKKSSFT